MLIAIFSDLQLNASFDQRIKAITPYIELKEKELLISEWACMKTRQDYLNINIQIDNYAQDAGVSIPEPLLK